MASRVRIGIQQRKTCPGPGDHIIGFVITGLGDSRKEALLLRQPGCKDVLDSPWSMQRFHRETLMRRAAKVKEHNRQKYPAPDIGS